jgi:hypothetical protein
VLQEPEEVEMIRRAWEVVLGTLGMWICCLGAYLFSVRMSVYSAAGGDLGMSFFVQPTIVVLVGFLVLLVLLKKENKWAYSLGISAVITSGYQFASYFGLSWSIENTATQGASATSMQISANTQLVIGIALLAYGIFQLGSAIRQRA